MACFKPIKGFRTADGSVVFAELKRYGDIVEMIDVPCGTCIGCRLERSRQWAMRCLHEAQLHEENCFVTLTYDDEHLPLNWSLDYGDFQRFMRRLRKVVAPKKVRFYMAGEYGEQLGRPHFHACLFGIDFPDKVPVAAGTQGDQLYTSRILDKVWGKGFCSIGDVSFQSAAYVARYVMKKVTGDAAEKHYRFVDPGTGELFYRTPEFNHMSLKPGIGAGWLERFYSDVYPHDYCVINGQEVKPPKYYDRLLKKRDPDVHSQVLADRAFDGYQRRDDSSAERLKVREAVARSRFSLKKRSLI